VARQVKFVLLGLLLASLASTADARRLALVIGNDTYQNVQPLKNARSDAKAIAVELKAVGFDVTTDALSRRHHRYRSDHPGQAHQQRNHRHLV
jgi:hypothetical protein